MNKGDCTHSDDERCIVGEWVVDELHKAVGMGCGFVETFEFWEYNVTGFDKGNNSGRLFVQYVNTFLKLKQESSGYPSIVRSEEDRGRYIADYRRAGGISQTRRLFLKMRGNVLWQS
jgi:hypothetical protein